MHLRNRFLRLWHDVDQTALQYLRQDTTPAADVSFNQTQFDRLFSSAKVKDPFSHLRAENEETSLFDNRGFYSELPLIEDILNTEENQVVYGLAGCGRTATAKGAFFKGISTAKQFWVYKRIHNLPELIDNTITELLVRNLLDYITQKPTLLLEFQEEQRILLAITLAQTLTGNYVRAAIARARQEKDWLSAANEDQSRIWLQVGDTQLQLLSDAIESSIRTQAMPEGKRLLAVAGCFQSFGFKRIRLLLDFAGNTQGQVEQLLPYLAGWENNSIISTLFIPDFVYGKTSTMIGHLQTRQLMWTPDDLRRLADHRFENISDNNPFLFFEDEKAYDTFFAPDIKTPRQLFRLWQATLELLDSTNPLITSNNLQHALTNLSK